MSENSVTAAELNVLKKKLDAAIKSRSNLEEDFKNQTTLQTKLISKLSLLSKGLDLKLDNKLANFRNLLTKSAPITDIENEAKAITEILTQCAAQNDTNLRELTDQFVIAGKSLQKVSGLPNQLRRDLRDLLSRAQTDQQLLIQYIPLLKELIGFFLTALNHQQGISSEQSGHESTVIESVKISDEIIKQFIKILDELMLPAHQSTQLIEIKKRVKLNIDANEIIDCFLETFELIRQNLQEERETAESFLSSLSQALATVQQAVGITLVHNKKAKKVNDKLNAQLKQQMDSMSETVDKANTLSSVKDDINSQLHQIAEIIAQKTKLEQESQLKLDQQLNSMQKEIASLELRSKQFESRLHEQQLRSMQDALTKLNNRAAFDDFFATEMVKFHQKPFPLSIAVMDIDNFKSINDTYGHSAGDKTLQVIAKTIQKATKKEVFSARYGGEEFVLIFNNLSKPQLEKQLNLFRKKIESLPFKFKNNSVTITMSIGATHVNSKDNIHIAFERADMALYNAKNNGKNQVVYVD